MAVDKAERLAAIRAANATAVADKPISGTHKASSDTGTQVDVLPVLGLRIILGLLFVVVAGLLVIAALNIWQPIVGLVLPSVEPNTYLSMSRSSAMVAYVLLWLSMMLGLSITSKVTRIWPGGPVALDLHQHLSLLGLMFTLFHVLVLLADRALDFTAINALLPFWGSSYRPMWYGLLGKIALYLMIVVTVSFYVRSRIGGRAWRLIHYASFAIFMLALAHGILAGSDTGTLWAQLLYSATGASLVVLLFFRIHTTRKLREAETMLRVGSLLFNPTTRVLTFGDASRVTLRAIEARLLAYLMKNAGKGIKRDQLITSVWGRTYLNEPEIATIYIRRLRSRIEADPLNPRYIQTAQEEEYRFEG